MSIINNAHPGSSIRLVNLIDRVLVRRQGKPISRSELIATCRPNNLPKSEGAGKRFESNLKFWIDEGLWQEDESGISLVSDSSNEYNLRDRIINLLIRRNIDKTICEGKRTEPFLQTITCLLAQNKYTFLGQHKLTPGAGGNVAEAVNEWLPNEMSINISNEASILLEYGEFLGFLEPFNGGTIVDPTRAILSVLPKVFAMGIEIPVREFLANLSEHLPMLDGGSYRQQIEPFMEQRGWRSPESHQVSASLSHALIRLRDDHCIALSERSDDRNSMVLRLPNENLSVSMVRYREV